MSFTFESVNNKPVGFWMLDDDSPFTDYSGYSRSGSSNVQPAKHVSLATGAQYSSVFDRDCVATFASPVFNQGAEDQPFTLGANVYPITNTTGYAAQPYRENLFTQPSVEGATDQWTNRWYGAGGGTGTIAVNSSGAIVGSLGYRKTWTASSTGGQDVGMTFKTYNLVIGKTYTFSAFVRASWATEMRMAVAFVDANGNTISTTYGSRTSTTANQIFRCSVTEIVPDGTVYSSVAFGPYPAAAIAVPVGATCDFDGAMVEQSDSVGTYFDGSMAGYEWAGTANNSISRTRTDVSVVNLGTSAQPNTVGTGLTLARGVSANGKTWTRLTMGASGTGAARTYVPLADLQPNGMYVASCLVYNDSASSVTVSIDWNDSGVTNQTILPGETKRISTVPARKIYDSVYHFFDVGVSANGTILMTEPTVFLDGIVAPYFSGDSDGAGWNGTPNASSSLMYVSDGEQQIVGNTGNYDGIVINGTKVSFVTKYTNTGECRAEYDLQVKRAFSVYGVHTADKNSLYIDGELVAEENVSEQQQADTYLATTTNLLSGQSQTGQAFAANGVAAFPYALDSDTISSLYESSSNVNEVAFFPYGGQLIDLGTDSTQIFAQRTWSSATDWEGGISDNVTIENDTLVQTLYGDTYLSGTWLDSFAMDSGITSVYGVYLDWDGEYVIVQASMDGTNWETATRGKNISVVPAGFDPTNTQLQIRVVFVAGSEEGYLESLTVVGLASSGFTHLNARAVTVTSGNTMLNDTEFLDSRWGVRLDGGTLTIAGDTTNTIRTIEIWMRPDPTLSTSIAAADAIYSNGGSVIGIAKDQWQVRTYVFNADFTSDITITGTGQIGRVVLYPTALTAAQVQEIYDSYFGRKVSRYDDDSVITVTEPVPATDIYARDWAISASG